MTSDADDAVVLDVIRKAFQHGGPKAKVVLAQLQNMPDKGPLARSLGITPSDLGLELRQFQWPGTKIDDASWVEP